MNYYNTVKTYAKKKKEATELLVACTSPSARTDMDSDSSSKSALRQQVLEHSTIERRWSGFCKIVGIGHYIEQVAGAGATCRCATAKR